MPPDKVKLSPESVRTFLEIGLKYAVDKQWLASEEQKKSSLYSFAKMLCIKKSNLYCSYPIDPGFYRLNLEFENPDSIKVYLASKEDNFFGKSSVSLNYDSVCKLVKLLNPSYVGASFDDNVTAANFEQYFELLKLTKRKIGLHLGWRLKEQIVKKFFEAFFKRTYVLSCQMGQFEAAKYLQFPDFDYLSVRPIANYDQISCILKRTAKELELVFAGRNFTIDAIDLVDLKNEVVEKLHLSFFEIDYAKVEKLVKQLPKCCSRLKHFEINKILFVHQEVISVNQISNQAVAYVKRMNDLKACLGNDLASVLIKFEVPILLNALRNNTWIKAVSEKPELKHWKFESEADEEYVSDTLVMKFSDARCKLEIRVIVFGLNPEDEVQFFEDDDEIVDNE